MGIVFILLPASLLLATIAVIAFIWAARNRQFDNIDVAAARLLFDDDKPDPVSDSVTATDSAPEGPQR